MDDRTQRWIQRNGWDRAAACYERAWSRQLRPATELVLHRAALQPGERVIDVACGLGAITLPAARAVGPTGRVLATDLAPRMIEALRARLERGAVAVVETEVADAATLGHEQEFDVAVCSLGLMYVPRPAAAMRSMAATLRPGGRTVVAVWGERARCGWAELFPIVDARVASDVCPLFFALGAPGALAAGLLAAGFTDVEDERIDVELVYGDRDEALTAAFAGGPVALAWSRFDDATRRSAAEEYLASIAPFADGPGYRVPGQFVVATGRRPSTHHGEDTDQ